MTERKRVRPPRDVTSNKISVDDQSEVRVKPLDDTDQSLIKSMLSESNNQMDEEEEQDWPDDELEEEKVPEVKPARVQKERSVK